MRIFLKDTDSIPKLPLGHTTAYRLTGRPPEYDGPHKLRDSVNHLHGCRIVRRWTAVESDVAAARKLFMDIKTYGNILKGALCYFPGFAFTFGDGTAAVDVLVCLECHWVVFHQGGQSVSVVPTDEGISRLRKIYRNVIEKGPTNEDGPRPELGSLNEGGLFMRIRDLFRRRRVLPTPWFEGGDGSSIERAVIVRGANQDLIGTVAEFAWMEQHYGVKGVDWMLHTHSHEALSEREIDTMCFETKNGERRAVHFDITESFGK